MICSFPFLCYSAYRRPLIAVILLVSSLNLIYGDSLNEDLPIIEPDRHMVKETRHVIQAIEHLHYLNEPIARIDFAKLLRDYMTDLDYNRLFFLRTDEVDFQRFTNAMHFYLISGNLHPAFEIYKVYRERALERIDWALDHLQMPFDFTTTDTYTPDRTEAEWPSDLQASEQLWISRLQYEILNELFIQHRQENKEIEHSSPEEAPEATATNSTTADTFAEDPSYSTGEAAAEPTPIENLTQLYNQDTERFNVILDKARETLQRRYQRWQRNIYETESQDVQEVFLNTLTHTYDPHSSFLSADSLEDFTIAMRNSLVGIGAVLSDEDGYCTIKELIPGGPASLSQKLKPNDKIVGVAQGPDEEIVDVIDMKLRKIVKQIRGKKGTSVRLLIQPAEAVDPSIRKEVSLVRDQIKLVANLATAQLIEAPHGENTVPIGVIHLPSFYGAGENTAATTQDVEELINKLKTFGIEGLVLDLRHNGGGLLNEAISLTGLFIPEGPVVQVRDGAGKVAKKLDTDPKIIWRGPLAVLISRHSASASEIVAGALQAHRRALVIGDATTHGKGTVQSIFEVNKSFLKHITQTPSGAAKITIQKFYLPSGNSTQKKGVAADIALPSINELLPIGESDLPNALSWDAIEPLPLNGSRDFTWTHTPLTTDLLENLREQSRQRQNTLQEFSYLRRNIEWFKDKQDQKVFSLNLENRELQKTADLDYQEQMDTLLEQLAEHQFETQEILLDVTLEQESIAQQAQETLSLLEEDLSGISTDELSTELQTTEIADDTLQADTEEESDMPKLDIPLRESLRVLSDWIHYHPADDETSPSSVHNQHSEAA